MHTGNILSFRNKIVARETSARRNPRARAALTVHAGATARAALEDVAVVEEAFSAEAAAVGGFFQGSSRE